MKINKDWSDIVMELNIITFLKEMIIAKIIGSYKINFTNGHKPLMEH